MARSSTLASTYSKAPAIFYQGLFASSKVGCQFTYKTSLERDALLLLEANPLVEDYDVCRAPFVWSDGVDSFKETIPFRYTTSQERKYLLEVAAYNAASDAAKPPPAEAARRSHRLAAAQKLGFIKIERWTDRYMRDEGRLSDAEALYFHRARDAADDHIVAINYALRRLGSEATIGALREASGLGAAARGVILELLARGKLRRVQATQVLDDACRLESAE